MYTGDIQDRLRQKFQQIFPFLDEKLRRLVAGSEPSPWDMGAS